MTTNLNRADQLIERGQALRATDPEAAGLLTERGQALATVTWARLLMAKRDDATASPAEREAARVALAEVGL